MKTLHLLGISLIVCLLNISPILAQNSWTVGAASVKFVIKNAGFNVDGSFGGLKAEIETNDQSLLTRLVASVDAATVNTNNRSRDGHLRRSDYFYVEKYPRIRIELMKAKALSAAQFEGTFKLTIRDITKQVSFPFTFKSTSNNSGIFEGEFSINRRDYGVGGSSWILSDNVVIRLRVEVKK